MTDDNDEVVVEFPSIGARIDRWKSYSYNSEFLTPTDGWSFTFGDDETSDEILRQVEVGQRLTLRVNGVVQGDGYIDDVDARASRRGFEVTISGRDLLAPVIDSHIEPSQTFKAGMTLADILLAIFKPFGFTEFALDNDANRDALKGSKRGTKVTKGGKKKGPRPLKSFVQHQLKPYPCEGAFAFAARLAQRHGLWIWLGADNKTIIVATPDFEQEPSARIVRRRGTAGIANTVLDGTVRRSLSDQPSCIVATGRGGGGENPRSGMRVIAINGIVRADTEAVLSRFKGGVAVDHFESNRKIAEGAKTVAPIAPLNDRDFDMRDDPYIVPILKRYPGAKVVVVGQNFATRYLVAQARPIYLQDDESTTLDQIEYFARREIALRQRKSFEANYTVQGHVADGQAWTVDTIVDVQDDVLGIHEPLYVLGRTLHKTRGGGTTTDLHLIRPGTLVF